jgi:hypothetical protein
MADGQPGLPPHILARFQRIPPNPRENDYYGPFNKLLNFLFPTNSDFTVAPQSCPDPASKESIDFLIEYTVSFHDFPVLVIEINAPSRLRLMSAQDEVDIQIRKRLADLTLCPLPRLRGFSAFGSDLCYYYKEGNDRIVPVAIRRSDIYEVDAAPQEWWSHNILGAAGADFLRREVAAIANECKALEGASSSIEIEDTCANMINRLINVLSCLANPLCQPQHLPPFISASFTPLPLLFHSRTQFDVPVTLIMNVSQYLQSNPSTQMRSTNK